MSRPMMRIGELAERAGVSRRSLRYYEQHGLLHSGRTDNGWESRFSDGDRNRELVCHDFRPSQ